jgi:hypothetical protein
VPVEGAVNELTLHADRPPFGTGTGGPKLQPVVVQSKPGPLVFVGPIGHAVSSDRMQPRSPVFRLKRLTAPSGSVDGAMPLTPLPRYRFPHVSGFGPRRRRRASPPRLRCSELEVSGGRSSVEVVVVVGADVVDVVAPVVDVVEGAIVDVVVVLAPNSRSRTVPLRLGTGTGQDAAPSMSVVAGMQKTSRA